MKPKGAEAVCAVSFDVGGTLIQPWPSVGHVYAAVAARHGHHLCAALLTRRFQRAWKARGDFGHSRWQWAQLVDRTFAGLVKTPPSASFFAEIYEQFAQASAWRVFEDVAPCLEQLKQRGLRLGVISNWDERLVGLLRRLKLEVYFDQVIVSIEAGSLKPEAAIFLAAAESLRAAPQAIVHVGDSLVEDIQGARSAGFQALLIRRGAPPRRGAQISALTDLVPLLTSTTAKA